MLNFIRSMISTFTPYTLVRTSWHRLLVKEAVEKMAEEDSLLLAARREEIESTLRDRSQFPHFHPACYQD